MACGQLTFCPEGGAKRAFGDCKFAQLIGSQMSISVCLFVLLNLVRDGQCVGDGWRKGH